MILSWIESVLASDSFTLIFIVSYILCFLVFIGLAKIFKSKELIFIGMMPFNQIFVIWILILIILGVSFMFINSASSFLSRSIINEK